MTPIKQQVKLAINYAYNTYGYKYAFGLNFNLECALRNKTGDDLQRELMNIIEKGYNGF